ncbi:MGMT family protein [Omnitrophica bacterium]|nr:MGMT family protein [Candidatus Omnitrophota bacterium]
MKTLRERAFDILRKRGFSPFEITAYREVSSIPWGQTKSYKWVARRLKSPQSQRAVGQALKRNPFPFIIPCHRVIRQDGNLGGFSCGRHLKKRLLELEKADILL